MKVLVAGASGAIGRQLVPALSAAGHEVVGLARSTSATATLAVDALDRDALVAAVRGVAPDAVVNMLTAIPARLNPRRMPVEFALTNRLRTEGTRNLLAAAAQSGARRIIAQGVAFAYEPGDGPADEEAPLWARPPAPFASSVAALRELEAMTTRADSTLARHAHAVIQVPTTVTGQFGGTLFEQSALLLLDAVMLEITAGDPRAYAAMRARHTNLQ